MSKQFYFDQFSLSLVHCLNIKTGLFQAIQFSISMQFSSVCLTDRTLSGATTSGQSERGSDGNEGVLSIPQSSNITRTSPSNCFVLYSGYSLGRESYSSAETQWVYSAAQVYWASFEMRFRKLSYYVTGRTSNSILNGIPAAKSWK